MKLTIADLHKRLRYLPENSATFKFNRNLYESCCKAAQSESASAIMRSIDYAAKDMTGSVPINLVLEMFDSLVETGTESEIKKATSIIVNEYVTKTRNAKETQTNIRRKLGKASGKINNRVQDNMDDAKEKINNLIGAGKRNFNNNINQVKKNIEKAKPKLSLKKNEELKENALTQMDLMITRMIHCDRILENYNRISKRFNIDKIIQENTLQNDIQDTVIKLCNLIETYEMPQNVKFNTVLETCWYGFNKSGMTFENSDFVTIATDYFLAKGNNRAMCNNILENSLVVSKKDYKGSDLSVITEEEPEEDEIDFDEGYMQEGKLSAKDRANIKSSDYGLPKKKKYPMPDESHVRAAIRLFNHVDKEDEAELARNIKKKIKEYNMDVDIGPSNRLSKYIGKEKVHEATIGEQIREYASDYSGFPIIHEDTNFDKIFNDFKASDDPHKENKLKSLINKLYTRSATDTIDGTPNVLRYIRYIFILGAFALQPVLGAVMAIADLFIKMHKDREETEKMLKCFKNESQATQKKIDSCKDPEEKKRLTEYKKTIDDAYKKIDEYYGTILSDEELDKHYEEEDNDGTLDGFNDDDDDWDLDDDDDFDDFDEAAKCVVYLDKLITIRENNLITTLNEDDCTKIISMAPNMTSTLTEVASKFPDIINPNILTSAIRNVYKEETSYSIKHNLSVCLESCQSIPQEHPYCRDIFVVTREMAARDKILEAMTDILNTCYYTPIEEAGMSFTNKIKLAGEKVKKTLQKLSDKDKTISKNIDVAANNFSKAAEKSLTNDNREAVIKGSILPSASKVVKGGILAAGTAILIDPIIAVIGVLGWLACSKKYKAKERQMVLDELEIELKMCEKYIALAEDKNDMKSLKKLYTIQRELERQRQRVKYKMKVDYGKKYYDADSTLQDIKD